MRENNPYLEVQITVKEGKWQLEPEALFQVVMRKNKKRHFLFASKVIGKYIAVHPYRSILSARLLAMALRQEMLPASEKISKSEIKEVQSLLENWNTLPLAEDFEKIIHKQYELTQKTLFIGFAETATGLGHGVFSSFQGKGVYIHTTRAKFVKETPNFIFEEEHSHAVDHSCYGKYLYHLEEYEQVVLIDDEITTGKTALNLIQSIMKQVSAKNFVILSLLDWRSPQDVQRIEVMEEALGVSIKCISLIRGEITSRLKSDIEELTPNNEVVWWQQGQLEQGRSNELVERQWIKGLDKLKRPTIKRTFVSDMSVSEGKVSYLTEENIESQCYKERIGTTFNEIYMSFDKYIKLEAIGNDKALRKMRYMKNATGRFGITSEKNAVMEQTYQKIGKELEAKRTYEKCLCLGTEEFIYIPNRIACYMGESVYFACSARSPIITMDEEDYALKDGLCYISAEDEALPIYLYNLENQGYEEVFWFLERDISRLFKQEMSKALAKRGIQKVWFVILNEVEPWL